MARSVDEDSLWSLERQGSSFVLLGIPMVSSNVARSLSIMRRAHTKRQLTCGHGHQRIGIITGLENSPDNKGRLQGYQKALLDAGIALQQKMVVPGNFKYEEVKLPFMSFWNATHRLPRFLQRTMRWQ